MTASLALNVRGFKQTQTITKTGKLYLHRLSTHQEEGEHTHNFCKEVLLRCFWKNKWLQSFVEELWRQNVYPESKIFTNAFTPKAAMQQIELTKRADSGRDFGRRWVRLELYEGTKCTSNCAQQIWQSNPWWAYTAEGEHTYTVKEVKYVTIKLRCLKTSDC